MEEGVRDAGREQRDGGEHADDARDGAARPAEVPPVPHEVAVVVDVAHLAVEAGAVLAAERRRQVVAVVVGDAPLARPHGVALAPLAVLLAAEVVAVGQRGEQA